MTYCLSKGDTITIEALDNGALVELTYNTRYVKESHA